MEVLEQSEVWLPVEDDLEFSHTTIIVKNFASGALFYSCTKQRYRPNQSIDISSLSLNTIPLDDVYPDISGFHVTKAPLPRPRRTYVKRPCLVAYPDLVGRYRPSDMFLQEARICEILRQNPHPNVATYFGVIEENNRLTGLCFAKYDATLAQRLATGDITDPDHVLLGIKCGIAHLHKLGLIHNDINPQNVMMTSDDNPVIIDFDSCRENGTVLGVKGGTEGWRRDFVDIAEPENDFYGLTRIAAEMKLHLDC
jgi:serine/threonine protein kinase